MKIIRVLVAGAGLWLSVAPSWAWDYEGHQTVNLLALASLPTNFPAFVQEPAARERVAFLAGEPDRWRNTVDQPLRHFNGPDHFFDFEDLIPFKLDPQKLSHFRYEFTAQMAAARALRPGDFEPIDEARNQDRTRGLPGFLPWAVVENYGKLKSGFSYLKVFEEMGTPEEVAQARQSILYIMGVMGHYVGDSTQPLHTTKHFNGWVGENPKGFTTNKSFHSWIDGGYLNKVGGLNAEELRRGLRAAQRLASPGADGDHVFPIYIKFLLEQFKHVEPLYEMDKDGRLSGNGTKGLEALPFLSKQIGVAAQMLGDLWLTAYLNAPTDNFLKNQLARRQLSKSAPPEGKSKK